MTCHLNSPSSKLSLIDIQPVNCFWPLSQLRHSALLLQFSRPITFDSRRPNPIISKRRDNKWIFPRDRPNFHISGFWRGRGTGRVDFYAWSSDRCLLKHVRRVSWFFSEYFLLLTNEGLFYTCNDIVTRFLYFSLPFAVLVLCRSKTTLYWFSLLLGRETMFFFPKKTDLYLKPILFNFPILFLTFGWYCNSWYFWTYFWFNIYLFSLKFSRLQQATPKIRLFTW